MPVAIPFAHHGQQKVLLRPSALDQHLALEKRQVLAIAATRIRIGPVFRDAVIVPILDLRDRAIDVVVDLVELRPARRGQREGLWIVRSTFAIRPVADAEADEALGRRDLLTGGHVKRRRLESAVQRRAIHFRDAARRLASRQPEGRARRQGERTKPIHLNHPLQSHRDFVSRMGRVAERNFLPFKATATFLDK